MMGFADLLSALHVDGNEEEEEEHGGKRMNTEDVHSMRVLRISSMIKWT
jgi:hypothetical protein